MADSLRDVILAKIDRKMLLLAELEAINDDLASAYAVLGEIPSLLATKVAAPVVVEAVVDPPVALVKVKKKYPRKTVLKPCARCGEEFELFIAQKFCKPCFSAQARERMSRAKSRNGLTLVEEIDMRLAVNA